MIPYEVKMRQVLHVHEVAVTDLVVTVQQDADAVVKRGEQHLEVHPGYHLEPFWLWLHLDKCEAAAEGQVQQGDGAVSRIHRAEQVEVGWHAEALLRVGQGDGDFIDLPEPLVVLDQGDEFAKDLGDVGAVDFVEDEQILGGVLPMRPPRRLGACADTPKHPRHDLVPDWPPLVVGR